MSVFHNNALIGAGAGTGEAPAAAEYVIPKSLRFNSGDTAHLSKTFSTAGNQSTWTWSAWIKRSKLGATTRVFQARSGNTSDQTFIQFRTDDKLYIGGNADVFLVNTDAVFRDPGAWGHLTVSFDTTQSTAADRIRVYWNGTQLSLSGTQPSQNYSAAQINSTYPHSIGIDSGGGAELFNGFLADIQFVDGQALAPTDFGETRSSDGVWVPKEYTGPYGPNRVSEATGALPILNTTGDFGGTAASGTRTDSNSSSIKVAIAMNGSDDGTTFTDQSASIRGSGSALTVTASGSAVTSVDQSIFYGSSGYFPGTANSDCLTVAAGPSISSSDDFTIEYWYYQTGQPTTVGSVIRQSGTGASDLGIIHWGGNYAYYPTNTSTGVATVNNEWTHVAFTRESGTVRLFVNGVLRWSITSNTSTILNSSNSISIGSSGASYGLAEHFRGYLADVRIYGGVAKYTSSFAPPKSTGNGFHLNFSDSSTIEALGFDSAPTTPDPDPKKGMDVVTYSGNGGTQNIGGLNFEPGLVWIKNRSSNRNHYLYDSIRGAGTDADLAPNTTDAENSLNTGTYGHLSTFNPDGFTVVDGSNSTGNFNSSSQNYVAWTWRAGGPAVANTAGTITTEVSANTDYGFSIIKWTGVNNASPQTVGHGLTSQTPKFFIVKNLSSSQNWAVYHASLGNTKYLHLNSADGAGTSSAYWNDTSPTSTLIHLNNNDSVQRLNDDFILYAWSEVAGYSKFGSYTGNGSDDGAVIETGFKPRWILIKSYTAPNANSHSQWLIYDTERSPSNEADDLLLASGSNAEFSSAHTGIDILDNGFKLKADSLGYANFNTNQYIYAAFADRPGNNWDVNNIVTNEGLTASKTQFDVVTYTGTGSSRSIDSLAFQPDFVWIKQRNSTNSHRLFDSIRGVHEQLYSDLNFAEDTSTNSLTAFNSDGFTVGSQSSINGNGDTFVAWCWKAGGTAVSNTDGSITSSVSANAAYGFSIATYTGTGSGTQSVGHGLSSVPALVITKSRGATGSWRVFADIGGTYKIGNLNNTDAFANASVSAPTSSVFNVDGNSNASTTHVAYCFANVPGYQRVGVYSGNGSSTGPVIVTGFKPRWILFKSTGSGSWVINDTQRDTDSANAKGLKPNAADAETDIVTIDVLDNGFQLKGTAANTNGQEYLYMAIGDDEIGSDEDCLVDVPNAVTADADATDTTGGYQRGNYMTINPLSIPSQSVTLSNGNLDMSGGGTNVARVGTIAIPSSGKWYWEITCNSGGSGLWLLGINGDTNSQAKRLVYVSDARKYTDTGGGFSSYGSSFTTGDVIGVAVDMNADTLQFYKNGVSQGTAFTSISSGYTDGIFPYFQVEASSRSLSLNAGQMRFKYPMPSGYAALNTTALPAATIPDGSAQFNAVKYDGNSGDGLSTTQGVTTGFAPGLVWIKDRTGTNSNHLFDTVRGAGKRMFSNSTSTESDVISTLSAFNSDGFTVNGNNAVNDVGSSYISWNWNAGENSNKTYTVKVVSDSGNKYRFDDFGTSAVTLDLAEGSTYIFDQSDSSNSGHPLRFSTTSDGTHGSGSEYTTGVTATGTPGSAGAKTTIVVAASAPTLYYYCSAHSGMGGQANTNSTAGSSNFDGTIQATVKANPEAGFSIVSWTGTGANATVGHSLNAQPGLVLVKNRGATASWAVWHTALTGSQFLGLNTTNAVQSSANYWNSTVPTTSVFSVGSDSSANGSSNNMIAYCMSPVTGYSAVGSYTGTGSTPHFLHLGFRPAFWMHKRTDSAGSWMMLDATRDPYNVAGNQVYANLSNAEGSGTELDFVSNGVVFRATGSDINGSGVPYIYICFAENPFQANGGLAR